MLCKSVVKSVKKNSNQSTDLHVTCCSVQLNHKTETRSSQILLLVSVFCYSSAKLLINEFHCSFINTTLIIINISPVGIATRYVLDGPGIESRWWA